MIRKAEFASGEYEIDNKKIVEGYCDFPHNATPARLRKDPGVIWVSPALKGKVELETWCHEATHSEFPDLEEDVVDIWGKRLARLLWGLGYRRR